MIVHSSDEAPLVTHAELVPRALATLDRPHGVGDSFWGGTSSVTVGARADGLSVAYVTEVCQAFVLTFLLSCDLG